MNKKVDAWIQRASRWQEEFELLRSYALDTGLDEELKWGQACYANGEHNVVLIHGFKEYCALLFFKGALMKDPKHLLVQQTENVQAARQMRFTSAIEIGKLEKTIKNYIKEAIRIERSGEKVPMKKTSEFKMPDEFKKRLEQSKALKKAFDALTPGRQRAYLLFFSSAKQTKTREARIEKSISDILQGKGLND